MIIMEKRWGIEERDLSTLFDNLLALASKDSVGLSQVSYKNDNGCGFAMLATCLSSNLPFHVLYLK